MAKKFIFSVISYMVLTFCLAYPWHFIWFKDLMKEFGIYNREEPIFIFGILALLIQGVVMAFIYSRLYKGERPLIEGIRFGLVIGAFLFSISTFANIAKIEVHSMSAFIITQATFHSIQFIITGAAIGLIYGKKDVKGQASM